MGLGMGVEVGKRGVREAARRVSCMDKHGTYPATCHAAIYTSPVPTLTWLTLPPSRAARTHPQKSMHGILVPYSVCPFSPRVSLPVHAMGA